MKYTFNTDSHYEEAAKKVSTAVWELSIKINNLPAFINMTMPTYTYTVSGETSDNYGMLSLDPSNRSIEVSELKHIITTTEFWDCECDKGFIHHECIEKCLLCNTAHEDGCNSRLDEIPDHFECTNCGETHVK